MKHVPGTKVDYYKLMKRRKHPLTDKEFEDWCEKLGVAKRKKLLQLLELQDGKCFFCNCELTLAAQIKNAKLRGTDATLDHKITRLEGGTDHRNNMVAACNTCNHKRGPIPFDEFLRLLANGVPPAHLRKFHHTRWIQKAQNKRTQKELERQFPVEARIQSEAKRDREAKKARNRCMHIYWMAWIMYHHSSLSETVRKQFELEEKRHEPKNAGHIEERCVAGG